MQGKVESIRLIKHECEKVDYLEVTIDFDKVMWFNDYTDAQRFIGKRVEYYLRKDVYEGKVITVIANISEFNVVQTLTAEENIKLIPAKDTVTAICNVDSTAFRIGDFQVECIAFLSGYELGSTKKAKWADCQMIDMHSKLFNVRIFTKNLADNVDAEEALTNLTGRYVTFNLESTKYGLQTDEISLYNVTVVPPPEVDIALKLIQAEVNKDEELNAYVQKYNLLEHLKGIIYYEIGYHLVYIAAEINMIKAVCNISDSYNMKSLIRAAVCSRGYLLPRKTELSRPLLNVNKVLSTSLVKDKELLLILDLFAGEEVSQTKSAYIEIASFTKKILDERRGEENEASISVNNIFNVRNQFGGLL